jgi:eukaryotic-like serine/threonine-protein kinase
MSGFEVGTTIDRRYVLKREIARGGVGIIFEAEHLFTKRSVALKLVTHSNELEARQRLLREAHALTIARNAGVVAVLDAGQTEDGNPYMALELLEGRSLAGILATKQRIGVAETVSLGIKLCDALAFVHARGVVHRDIKPDNIFVARDETGHEVVKLVDFGIAGFAGTAANVPKLTQVGSFLGTPEYMAPEQLLAREDIDSRADIYALGVTLYECLAGVVPFEGNFGEVLLKVSSPQTKPAVALPSVPIELGKAIDQAISSNKEDRFASASAFGRALMQNTASITRAQPLLGLRKVETTEANTKPTVAMPRAAQATRRRFARAPYTTPVRILREKKPTLDGRSEDISVGGLLVLTETPCEAQEPVRVRFALPMTGKVIEVAATARWVKMARRTGAVGLEFSALPQDVHDGIALYVKAMGGT